MAHRLIAGPSHLLLFRGASVVAVGPDSPAPPLSLSYPNPPLLTSRGSRLHYFDAPLI
jgi:hypothetical protein